MSIFSKLFRKTPTTVTDAPTSIDVARVLVDAQKTAAAMSSIISALHAHQPSPGKAPAYVPLAILQADAHLDATAFVAGLFCLEKRFPGSLWPSMQKPSAVVIGPDEDDEGEHRFAMPRGDA